MAGMDILKSAGESLTGAVEKAYLEFEDERIKANEVHITDVQARQQVQIGSLGNMAAVGDKAAQTAAAVSNVAAAVRTMSGVADAVSSKKKYEVKFNPNEITIQAKGGEGVLVQKMNFASSGKVSAKFSEMKTDIMMNVPLLFDDMERTDAFMMEKFTDLAALTRTGVTSLVNEGTGKTYSVRPQVEGFLGALHNEKTRKITLSWGNMAYRGILSSVDAEYTMFNMAGNPIRAVVNLQIQLVDERVRDNDMGLWADSYDKVFDKDGFSTGSFTSVGGNLLNINL